MKDFDRVVSTSHAVWRRLMVSDAIWILIRIAWIILCVCVWRAHACCCLSLRLCKHFTYIFTVTGSDGKLFFFFQFLSYAVDKSRTVGLQLNTHNIQYTSKSLSHVVVCIVIVIYTVLRITNLGLLCFWWSRCAVSNKGQRLFFLAGFYMTLVMD